MMQNVISILGMKTDVTAAIPNMRVKETILNKIYVSSSLSRRFLIKAARTNNVITQDINIGRSGMPQSPIDQVYSHFSCSIALDVRLKAFMSNVFDSE